MSGQGYFIAWVIGLHMGAACLAHRRYLVTVAAFLTMIAGSHFAGIETSWMFGEILITTAFVIVCFGVVLGALAMWKGKA